MNATEAVAAAAAAAGVAGATRRSAAPPVGAFWELSKPGIAIVALVTTFSGFFAASRGPIDCALLAKTLFGTALAAAGAGALNMLIERGPDSLMRRTAGRPLPSGRVHPEGALWFGSFAAISGVVALSAAVGPLTGGVAAASLVAYLFLYTPLKSVSPLCLWVGAASGALPPVIGWTAARGSLGAGAVVLFLILYLWQFPHIMALAWMYREDYARAGFRMIPSHGILGETGTTALYSVGFCLALIPVSLLPASLGLAHGAYAPVAAVLGGGYALAAAGFFQHKTMRSARTLFFASIAYTPLLLGLLALTR